MQNELKLIEQQISEHLELIAQLYILEGKKELFRQKTFAEAARLIAGMPDFAQRDLSKIKGFGSSVIEVIDQFVSTGTSDRLQTLNEKWPVEAMTMTKVEGIGPKTALKFHTDGIKNLEELVIAATAGKVAERHASHILAAAAKLHGRVPYAVANQLAQTVVDALQQIENTSVTVCGSLRRHTIDSKDIDLIVATADSNQVLAKFQTLGEFINSGEHKSTIRIHQDSWQMKVDLWIVERWHLGSAIIYATGSKEHCVALRALSKSRGYTLNEYGIFPNSCTSFSKENQLAGLTEESLYLFLNLNIPAPENRTGSLS